MKSLNKLFLLISSILISSCTSNDITENLTEGINQIRFTASDFKYTNNSRTAFTISNNGAEFKWAENDTVGIFPNTGSQVYFPMQSGAGTKTATFDGGGWALKSSSTYAAYYPFKGDIYLDKTAIPVSYVGQKQVGNNSTKHLGAYDYMAAVASTPENGNVDFNFKHLGCLVQLCVFLPKATELTSIIFKTDEKVFIDQGVIDLSSKNPEIMPIMMQNSLSIELENAKTEGYNKVLVYFMINPLNLENKIIHVTLKDANKDVYNGEINGIRMEKGKAYQWQTTVSLGYAMSVNLTTPGTLGEILGDKITQIPSLKISGNMNNADMTILRRMTHTPYIYSINSNQGYYYDNPGILKMLDLTDAKFVKGSAPYLSYASYDFKYQSCGFFQPVISDEFRKDEFENKFLASDSLETIFWPNQVDSIKGQDFSYSSIKSITLNNNVTYIGVKAFYGSKIESITIPEKVTFIGWLAFDKCEFLETIYVHAITPPILDSNLGNINENTKIYVPKESVEAYMNDKHWEQYKKNIYTMP